MRDSNGDHSSPIIATLISTIVPLLMSPERPETGKISRVGCEIPEGCLHEEDRSSIHLPPTTI